MTRADPQLLRAEHDAMLGRLSSRRSMLHFAHASIAAFVGLILCGAAGKLWWDFGELHVEWTTLVGVCGVAALVYSGARYVAGRKVLTVELSEFEKLKALRSSLKLDEPAVLP